MPPCLAGVPTGVCQLGLRLPISMLSRCQLQGDINFTIVLAPPHWAPLWSGLKVFVKTDSPVAAAILNKGSNGCLVIMGWIHSLFWLKKYYNFSMFIRHIPGSTSPLAHSVLPLDDVHHWPMFQAWLSTSPG